MCGIAGRIARREDAPDGILERMLDVIRHRGPDGDGVYREDQGAWRVELGHRRLAIIDLHTGQQPLGNEDGSVQITFNGEIYNYRELRPALERAGHRFRTKSDTEVIVHHHEERGQDGVRDLDGMFAYAIWEAKKKRLTLARDRFGIKPLYVAPTDDGGVVFASELSAVMADPRVRRDVDPVGLSSLFFSDYVHPPHTILARVTRVPPGCYVTWEDGRLSGPVRYWSPPVPDAKDDRPLDMLARELWERLGDAVERQLVADVPVGLFLSGGLDSSSVAALASKRSRARMLAFSIGFEEKTFDESSYARDVARRIDVEHVEEQLKERDLLEVVDAALDHLDEPLADPSILPTYLLSRLAARHVKVVLSGDAGDELLAGYPTYKAHAYARILEQTPRILREAVIPKLLARLPIDDRYQSLEWKLRRFFGRWDDDDVTRHLRWMSAVDLPDLPRALAVDPGQTPPTLSAELPITRDTLHKILVLDFTTYMPGSVLTKVDRASMAHSLEVRPPILDNAFVDWAYRLPSRTKLRHGDTKHVFKLAARGKLPDAIIDRPKKGFGIPLAQWLRGPLEARMSAILDASPAWDLGLLRRETFAAWWGEHRGRNADHAKPLFNLMVLHHWLKKI